MSVAQVRLVSDEDAPAATDGQTRSLFDRLVTLVEEQKRVAADIKDMRAEIKSAGHDAAEMVLAVKLHLEPEKAAQRDAQKEGAERILAALGLLADTPLGQAAMRSRGH